MAIAAVIFDVDGGRTEADLRQAGAVGIWADPVDLLAHLDEALALARAVTSV